MIFQLGNFNDFINVTQSYKMEINDKQLDLFKKYHRILLEWNKKINLISRKGEASIIEKHFLDSIIFLPEIESHTTYHLPLTTVLDIGSGGGFPAIPLAIMKPDWEFTLCESIKKKCDFLNHLVQELDLKNATIVNARVEALHTTPLRKSFDVITCRAVAKLDELIKYSLPLLKPGSSLLAYKAKDINDEIKNAEKFIEKKNLKLNIDVVSKEINGVERRLIILKQS